LTTNPEILTDRLRLRRWHPSDLDPFAAMNADPRVAEYLPTSLSRSGSEAFVTRVEAHFEQHGFGHWAVEVLENHRFAGYVGLMRPRFETRFTPCVEVGWRLAAEHWGKGYATEGASAAIAYGFDVIGLREILSWTVPANMRSRRVMEKLGMTRDPADDFDHPLLPEGHPLRRHVLYRIARPTRDGCAAPVEGSSGSPA
jgi:RimJ/RimL family protein N-acetyltransferase